MKITKIQAARNQINIAVYLYFNDMDLVSAHTLSGAARNIVYDLGKKKRIRKHPLDIMKTGHRDSYEIIIRQAQNFFKHAGEYGDHKKKFDLSEEMTENLLYDAISRYYSLNKRLSNHMKIFNSYFYLKNFDNIKNKKIKKIVEKHTSSTIPEKSDFYKSFTKEVQESSKAKSSRKR